MGYMTSIGLYVPNWTVTSITGLIIGAMLSVAALGTITGEDTPYSKFGSRKSDKIPSRPAMLVMYAPSVIACLCLQRPSFDFFTQFDLIRLLVLVHFAKRLFEVLYIHIYSSKTDLTTTFSILISYTSSTLFDLLVVRTMPENVFSSKLTTVGVLLVIFGESCNAYHHVLLRRLRLVNGTETKKYILPRGGLFDYCVAPHYFAEQLVFLGLILCSQNIITATLKLFPFIYLSVRAKNTHEWYATHLSNKQDKQDLVERKNLIPFIW